jgi:hypothetical protein
MATGSRTAAAAAQRAGRNLNIVIQPKGGVGKSFIASLLAEYLQSKKRLGLCIDLDVSNVTFGEYKEFNVRRIDLIENKKVDQRKFDVFIDNVLGAKGDIVVDTGANTYHPLTAYLHEEGFIRDLIAEGLNVVLHVPVTSAVAETLEGLEDVAKSFPAMEGISIVVWANRTFGPIELAGQPIETMKAYETLMAAGRIDAEVVLEKLEESTGETAVRTAIRQRKSLHACSEDATLPQVQRWRYKRIAADLYASIEHVGIG